MIPFNHFTDESKLIKQCVAGNRFAQEKLYQLYSGKMYLLCLRYVTNTEAAQDLLQEGFIKVFRYLPDFRLEGSLEGWIRRIFVNNCIGFLRKQNLLKPISEMGESVPEDSSQNGFERLSLKEIQENIQNLSHGYRTVFNLYAIEGFNHREIANILDITEGTSKSQLARARQILQKALLKN